MRPHTLVLCSNDSKVVIAYTQDPTETHVIKRDFSRKTNIGDDQLNSHQTCLRAQTLVSNYAKLLLIFIAASLPHSSALRLYLL